MVYVVRQYYSRYEGYTLVKENTYDEWPQEAIDEIKNNRTFIDLIQVTTKDNHGREIEQTIYRADYHVIWEKETTIRIYS